jgi:hypothetical protein
MRSWRTLPRLSLLATVKRLLPAKIPLLLPLSSLLAAAAARRRRKVKSDQPQRTIYAAASRTATSRRRTLQPRRMSWQGRRGKEIDMRGPLRLVWKICAGPASQRPRAKSSEIETMSCRAITSMKAAMPRNSTKHFTTMLNRGWPKSTRRSYLVGQISREAT